MAQVAGYRITPPVMAVIFMFVVTVPLMVLSPVVEWQKYFWAAAVVTFVIGDSVTTALLGRFGLEEMERGYTRWACGAEPTIACAFSTRVIAFGVIGSLYLGVVQTGFGLGNKYFAIAVVATPIVLSLGGLAATVLNGTAIALAARRRG